MSIFVEFHKKFKFKISQLIGIKLAALSKLSGVIYV